MELSDFLPKSFHELYGVMLDELNAAPKNQVLLLFEKLKAVAGYPFEEQSYTGPVVLELKIRSESTKIYYYDELIGTEPTAVFYEGVKNYLKQVNS